VSSNRRLRLGALGERLAADHLQGRGCTILDRNFRTRHGELDLVARSEGSLVFCEVKTRVLHGDGGPFAPLAGIGGRKRRQLRRMAREWLAAGRSGSAAGTAAIRFDAVGVALDPQGRLLELEHVEDAF
jgi:putative endonuclease